MAHPRFGGEEIQRRAEEIYEQKLRQQLETEENIGKVLVMRVYTGSSYGGGERGRRLPGYR